MIGRMRSLLTGLCALLALTATVVGLPVVLYRVGGWPLPRRIASWHHLVAALTQRDDGSLLLGTIRDLSWLAWVMFTMVILAEVHAALRGRAAPRMRRLAGLQGGAARLVALAALSFSAPGVITIGAATAATGPAHTLPKIAEPRALLDAAISRLVTVRSGDCLWTIAQRYLGAGDLYPEIASMNYGRDMGNGQVFSNPSEIEPGWKLLLPEGGGSVRQVPNESANSAVGSARHPGHATGNAHYRRMHWAACAHQAPGLSVAATDRTSPPAHRVAADASAPVSDDAAEAVVFTAGSIAGAILSNLTRLRSRQRQYRLPGRRIKLPADPDVLAVEQCLKAAAPVYAQTALREALGCLGAAFASSDRVLPDIVGLHVTEHVLEVLLASPAAEEPPAPYAISPGRQGMCWQLDLPAQTGLGSTPAVRSGLLPGLFTAGSTSDGHLLVDLESLLVTGCDGPPELVEQVVTAVATELATRQWNGWYDLLLVGYDELETLGRAEHCASLDEALALLSARCQRVRQRTEDDPFADLRQLRLIAPDDEDWGLAILVSRFEPTPEQLAALLEVTEDGPGGMAALVAGDPQTADGRMAPAVLQLAPDPLRTGSVLANVVPLQITVRSEVLTTAEYQAISTLFATAADTTDLSPQQAPYELYSAPPWIPQAATRSAEPAMALRDMSWDDIAEYTELPSSVQGGDPAEIEPSMPGPARQQKLAVQILGPLLITGAAEQLQPKQAELVVALALAAPGGLSNSALCSMLGADPDHPKPPEALRQIIARTRHRIGRAGDGREYIIHAGNGMYLLHPDASLDWTGFRNLIASSRAEDMRAALEMIRGEPFSGSYYWWIDIPLLETVRAEVVDTALALAEFELATGSARAAARAARAGLTADVSAEQLWRLLMRAEHAEGNAGGVAEAWRHCLGAMQDIAPDGEPHPDTAALYRQLTEKPWQHVSVDD